MLRRIPTAFAAALTLSAFALGSIAAGSDPQPGSGVPAKSAPSKTEGSKPTPGKPNSEKPNSPKPADKPVRPAPNAGKPAPSKPNAVKPAPEQQSPAPEKPQKKEDGPSRLEQQLYRLLDHQLNALLDPNHDLRYHSQPVHPHGAPNPPVPAPQRPSGNTHYHGDRRPGAPHPGHEPLTTLPKTSEFAERLLLLEFSDKRDPRCANTVPLINEMIRKRYPIQRVERGRGGETLFRRYGVREVPTYIMLVDGRVFGKYVVRTQDVEEVRVELLTLFQRGKVEVERRPKVREAAPRIPYFGLIFKSNKAESGLTVRAQTDDGANAAETPVQTLSADRVQQLSDVIGKTRLESALTAVSVDPGDGSAPRQGTGVAIHYNAEYQEALFVTSAALFSGIDVSANAPSVDVRAYSPLDEEYEDAVGQCVYCDAASGVALVAARVVKPTVPVAFLPKQSSLKPGEYAYEFARQNDELASAKREALSVSQRRFYAKEDGTNSFVLYDQLSGQTLCAGAGCFAARSGRFYFAGLSSTLEGSPESVVTPVAIVEQALLSNRNLSGVYRDQVSGKFDIPASQEEIQYALKILDDPKGHKPQYAIAEEAAKALETTTSNAPLETEESDAQLASKGSESESVVSTLDVPAPGFDETELAASDEDIDVPAPGVGAMTKDRSTSAPLSVSSEEELAGLTPPTSPELASVALKESRSSAMNSALDAQFDEAFPSDAQHSSLRPEDPKFSTAGLLEEPPLDALEALDEDLQQNLPQARETASAPIASAPQASKAGGAASNASDLAVTQGSSVPGESFIPSTEQGITPPAAVPSSSVVPKQTIAQQSALPETVEPTGAGVQQAPNTERGSAIPQYAEQRPLVQQAPLLVSAQTPDGRTVQYLLDPSQIQNAEGSQGQPIYLNVASQAQLYADPNGNVVAYAAPAGIGVRPTAFDSRASAEALAAYEREEEAFNAAVETLRKYALEGAEIVCIVNHANSDPNAPKESEVVRLPKRSIPEKPTAPNNIELVRVPAGTVVAPMQIAAPYAIPVQNGRAPLTAEAPSGAVVK